MTVLTRVAQAALLTLAICARATAQQTEQPAPPPPHAIGIRLKAAGIPNFGQVTPNLYRGAQPSAEGIASLKKLGVEIDVDLRGNASKVEESEANKLGMQYISIPSHCPFPRDEPWVKFLRVIRDNPGKKVFVHCRLGDDRTGMAVASYRMAIESWSAEDAMKEMKMFGFSTAHHAICPRLAEYETSFPHRLKTNPAFKELGAESQQKLK